MNNSLIIFLYTITIQIGFSQTSLKILKSNVNELILKIECNPLSQEDLKPINLLIGLPSEKLPIIEIKKFEIKNLQKKIINNPTSTKWIHNQVVNGLNTGTLQISPTIDSNSYYKSIVIKIPFKNYKIPRVAIKKKFEEILSPKITNWNIAKNWILAKKRLAQKKYQYPEGNWIKFSLENDGVHKIKGSKIKSLLNDQSLEVDPRSVMIFTSSSFGRDRTFNLTNNISNGKKIPENLIEISISINGESDGNLGDDDAIFFYGKGPSGFDHKNNTVSWHQNLYFNESIYWILIPSDLSLRGKRIQTGRITPDGPLNINYGNYYIHLETDSLNPQESGLSWGEVDIRKNSSYIKEIEIKNPLNAASANGYLEMIGNESVSTRYKNTKHKVSISLNSSDLSLMSWSNLGHQKTSYLINGGYLKNGLNQFLVKNISDNPNSAPLLDNIGISYKRKLVYDQPFDFFSPLQASDVTFEFSGLNLIIWNISKNDDPENRPINSLLKTTMRVSIPNDILQRFYVFKHEDIPEIINFNFIGRKNWDILRNGENKANHIIIGPSRFKDSSMPLANHRGDTFFASLEDIYGEFSGGNSDPIAIREFLFWTQNNWKVTPTTVLFMGDADFDYRNITGQSKIIVPTIQVGTAYSHATDDRLVSFNGRIPEMATGRFPARSAIEVSDFVIKIIEFETNMPKGSWKQNITLVADDPSRPEKESFELSTGKSHTINSERVASIIPNFIEVKKIYMIEFPEENSELNFNIIKPLATKALIEQIAQGTSIINFIGHGNSTQWAQEKLLSIDTQRNDLDLIKTNMKLPLWIAGTCNWGHFDSINKESFAEELIRKKMDGASAIISTSRGITVSSNIKFLEQIFKKIFDNESVSKKSLGSILQSVKTGGQDGELFHLFGDPSMKLSIPKSVIKNIKVSPDTLKTLQAGTLTATVPSPSGGGVIILKDGSNKVTQKFIFSSKQYEISYEKNGPTLFKGLFTYKNNLLDVKFRIPKDISYSSNSVTVRFSTIGTDGFESIGSFSNIILKLGAPSTDTEGPIIMFESSNGKILKNGDNINIDSNLKILISDPLGVNITGEKNHEIKIKNNFSDDEFIISDQFIYDENSITKGSISIDQNSNNGIIDYTVIAWDNANNPREATIKLSVFENDELKILNLVNFPNPFSNKTKFTFELTANAQIKIDIYTIGGHKIKRFYSQNYNQGYNYIEWDGKDEYGNLLSNGVYIYKITAKDGAKEIKNFGRLAIFK